MADHPLKPATDRRLGRPLPHQLANQTQNPLLARQELVRRFYTFVPKEQMDESVRFKPKLLLVLAVVSNSYPPPKDG